MIMSLFERLKTNFEFSDARGKITQLVHDGYKQINILESYRGVTRGGHFHKVATEAFFVISGSVDVELKRDTIKENIRFSKNDFFMIRPFVVHSMSFSEDCLLVAMYDTPVEFEDGTMDIYSEEV